MDKKWQRLSLDKKISVFIGTMFIIVVAALLLDVLFVFFFMAGFNDILVNNARGGEMVLSIKEESADFERYVRAPSEESLDMLKGTMAGTRKAIYDIPLDYDELGEQRYAQIQAIRDCYETYSRKRNEILLGRRDTEDYIEKLYIVYNMQDYLEKYAQSFVSMTLEEGNARYSKLFPRVFIIPITAVAIFVVLFIILIQLSEMMKKSITEPVISLAKASRRIADNDFTSEDIEYYSEDELGELVRAFNKMKYATEKYILALEEKRIAIDQLHAREMEKLEAQKQLEAMNLEVLKNQINPHFLFNTLNVIGGMANLEDAVTTEKMIGALSSLFRYNLKTQEAEVPLFKELKVAEDYMYLQKMRFGSRVNYKAYCEVDTERARIPTFTLQPLLENSVIHGLSPKEEGGEAVVEIKRTRELLCITVSDSGSGMDEETLFRLRESLTEGHKNRANIGISNIYNRITAMYDNCSLTIDSKAGYGTRVQIEIPYME